MNPGTFAGAVPAYPLNGWKRQIAIFSSQTWTVPRTGYYTITAIGGGGSGAYSSSSGNPLIASGGGAGGFAQKNSVLIYAGAKLNLTVGAGGTFSQINPGNSGNGAAGGNTIVSGAGVSLFAGGGGAGVFQSGINNTQGGGAGGTASGGDLNFTGGSGGTCVVGTSGYAASGGGGVSLIGVSCNGGNATANNAGLSAAGGGGGSGGAGGNATATATEHAAGAGGSAWGAGTAWATGSTIAYNTPLYTNVTGLSVSNAGFNNDMLSPEGIGTTGNAQQYNGLTAQAGAGSGGLINFPYYNTQTTQGDSYCFGGTGGVIGPINVYMYGGNAYFGGGSGGVINANGSGTTITGRGGSGLVIITWVQQ